MSSRTPYTMFPNFPFAVYRTHVLWIICVGICLFGLSPLFKPLIIAVILSYILNKPIAYLDKHHIARPISALWFISIIIAGFVGFMMIVLPFINDNVILISQKIPSFLDYIGEQVKNLSSKVLLRVDPATSLKFSQTLQNHIFSVSQQILMSALSWVQRNIDITNMIYYCVVMPFMVYYMSIDFPKILRFLGSLLPLSKRIKFQRVVRDMDKIFFLYFTGQSLVSVALVLAYAFCLYFIGIKYALMLGILVGLLSFIPYVGFIVGFFLVSLVALAQHEPSWALFARVGSVFFVLSIVETQVLSPRLIGKRLGVPPLVFILAIVVANYYFGVLGMFLAYPLTATAIKLWSERREQIKVLRA